MAKHVLVVHDHPAVALALRIAFKRDHRFELASAATAAEGLERVDGQDACCSTCTYPISRAPNSWRRFARAAAATCA